MKAILINEDKSLRWDEVENPEIKAQILSELVKNVFPKIETGEIMPAIHKVLPIEKAEEAHSILYNGENVGKVVLQVK